MAMKNIEIEKKREIKLSKGLVILGTIILCVSLTLLSKYLFVDKSNIKDNYSTDKSIIYISIMGEDKLITTQKYISGLGYNMRYDNEKFKVFRYKNQDIYRFINNLDVVFSVEKAIIPEDCVYKSGSLGVVSCYKKISDTMEEYYLTTNNRTYKIFISCPNNYSFEEGVKVIIDYMIGTFEIRDEY